MEDKALVPGGVPVPVADNSARGLVLTADDAVRVGRVLAVRPQQVRRADHVHPYRLCVLPHEELERRRGRNVQGELSVCVRGIGPLH